MATQGEWKIPAQAQPRPADYCYDLDRALSAVLALSTRVPDGAFTAETLGTERAGNLTHRPNARRGSVRQLAAGGERGLARLVEAGVQQVVFVLRRELRDRADGARNSGAEAFGDVKDPGHGCLGA